MPGSHTRIFYPDTTQRNVNQLCFMQCMHCSALVYLVEENSLYHSIRQRYPLTLPMLRLLSSKAQDFKDFWRTSKTYHVGIHKIALAENSPMSTYVPGFQSLFRFFASFCIHLAKLAASSIKVKENSHSH